MCLSMNLRYSYAILVHFMIISDRVFSQNSTSTSAPVKKTVHFDDPCYSKLLSGKRIIDNNGKRSFGSYSIHDCSKACNMETNFYCSGFNYRHNNFTRDTPICELISKTYVLPFAIQEPEYDYYEKNRRCKNLYDMRFGLSHRSPNPKHSAEDQKQNQDYNSYDLMFPKSQPSNSYLPPSYGTPQNNVQTRYGLPRNEVANSGNDKNANSWGSYGGTYGSSFNYEISPNKFEISTNSITYLPPTSSSPEVTPSTTINSKDTHVGDISTKYKGSFIYENTNVPLYKSGFVDKSQFHHDGHRCFARAKAGFKIAKNIVQKNTLALDIKSCEDNCAHERAFFCQTFAFRYNVDSTNPADNCFLSAVPLEHMDFYTNLEPDRNYDIYTTSHDHHICYSHKHDHKHHHFDHDFHHDHDHGHRDFHDFHHNHHHLDDCFWRVKSGYTFPKTIIKISAFVDNLGECQLQCTKVRDFICRSFVFRFKESSAGTSNCYLSDYSYKDFNLDDMVDMNHAEMYERNSFGRGCEPHPFLLYDHPHKTSGSTDESCYVGHHKSCKLNPSSVKFSVHVNSESECRERCTLMRRKNILPCISFSYSNDPVHDNCLMTDLGDKDLRPHFDYSYHEGHVLFSWQELDPKCSHFDHHHDHHPNDKTHYEPHNLFHLSPPKKPPFHRLETPEIHLVKPDHSAHDNSHYQYHHTGHQDRFFEYDYDPKLDHGPFYPVDNIFHHYTVKGFPCKQGSVCEKNKIGSFWSCETEGEAGSWDYCCEPEHHCGFSEGYPYPWCRVGPDQDQWRPCSERYYPYGPQLYTDKKCEGRHWPVTYLHGKSPPNATT